MARDKRRFEIEDTRNETYVGTGARPYLKLPSGLGLFKPPKAGTFRLEFIPFEVSKAVERFLPSLRFARPGKWYWERTFFIHEDLGADRQKHLCAKATLGKPCPVCDARDRLRASPNKVDKDAAWNMRPKENQVFLVQPRNDRSGALEGPIQLWDIKNFSFGKQLDEYKQNADPEDYAAYNRFYDPIAGLTVKVNGVETPIGEGRNFSKYSVLEFKGRREALPEELFDHGYDLDAIIRETPYDILQGIFGGATDDDADAGGDGYHQEAPPPAQTAAPKAQFRASQPTAQPKRQALPPAPEPESEPEPLPEADPFDQPSEDAGSAEAGGGDSSAPFQVGDPIRFSHKGQETVGRVAVVDPEKQMIHVPIVGQERPKYLDWDEATVISDEEFERAITPPAPKPAKAAQPAPKAATAKPATPPAQSKPAAAGAAPKGAGAQPRPARPSAWDDQGD